MRFRHLVTLMFAGLAVAFGCGDSGDDGGGGDAGSGGSAASGSGGSAADGGSLGGSTSVGGTVGVGGSSASAGASGSTATGGAAGSSGATGGAAGSAGSGTGGSAGCYPKTCQGKVYQCGDCIDNDGDGKVDVGEDPDCLGPCHNAENTFYGSIPGQAGPNCDQDCYFDQDSGSGNDDCFWNHKCDPLSVAPNYPPEFNDACACTGPTANWDCTANVGGTSKSCYQLYQAQEQACEDYCGPLTPNGCDCFGCCELPAHSGQYVWLGTEVNDVGTCDLQSVNDPTKCGLCTPVAACLNKCEKCELCLGKTELPPECFPPPADGGAGTGGTGGSGTGGTGGGTGGTGTGGTGGGTGGTGGSCPTPVCDPGVQPCGLSCLKACPNGYYCLTGCCQPVPT